jgi:hypothetical protein
MFQISDNQICSPVPEDIAITDPTDDEQSNILLNCVEELKVDLDPVEESLDEPSKGLDLEETELMEESEEKEEVIGSPVSTTRILEEPSKSVELETEAKMNHSGSPVSATTVLDNITNNSNRNLLAVSPSSISVCSEEDIFASSKPVIPPSIPSKVADFAKGVCY